MTSFRWRHQVRSSRWRHKIFYFQNGEQPSKWRTTIVVVG